MTLYSRLMYLLSHFLQTFEKAFVTVFFEINTQIFHPMVKDLKTRYVAYQNTLAENLFRQQQEDIAFATRKRSFLAQVVALEPQRKIKHVEGGWKLVWQWTGPQGTEGKAGQGEFRRVYLHQESRDGGDSQVSSTHSLPCFVSSTSNLEPIQAAALVSGRSRRVSLENQVGPALIHPTESARKGLAWFELLEGGVKQALIVGFGGINGILNYTPTILEEFASEITLSSFGITSDSASLLSSAARSTLYPDSNATYG
ncbi:hypothetical protein L7F22_054509 [Adiantum nelumboides]|nr:hypothetical protein [Adiantum nelumboides]